MEIRLVDFFLGLTLGAGLGAGICLAAARGRRWLGRSEAGRLSSENRELKRRLAEKDFGTSAACSPKPNAWRKSCGRKKSDGL